MNYIIQRGLSAAAIYILTIYIANRLGSEEFGAVAFLLFLTKFMHITNLGSVSGYLYRTYNAAASGTDRYYTAIYFAHLIIASCAIMIVMAAICWSGGYRNCMYIWPVLLFLVQSPIYAIEPVSRVQRKFYVSLLPELMLVASVAASVAIAAWAGEETVRGIFGIGLLILAVFVVIFIFLNYKSSIAPQIRWYREAYKGLRMYGDLLKKGFPLYAGTMLFLVFLLIDRFYLRYFHPEPLLGIYMMAFNFAFVSSLVIGSLNFTNVVNIGEAIKAGTLDMNRLRKSLKYLCLAGAGMYMAILAASVVAERTVLRDYAGLSMQVAMLSVGFICFYISGNFSPLLFFSGRQRRLNKAMIVIVVLSVISNTMFAALGVPGRYIPAVTSLLLVMYSVYSLACSFNVVTSDRRA